MRRIALTILLFMSAMAQAERPGMPLVGQPTTMPAEISGGVGRPRIPVAETRPVVTPESMPEEPVVATQPSPVETPAETQPAEVDIAPSALPSVTVEERSPELSISFSTDHASAIYYAKEEARIDVFVELPRWAPERKGLAGKIEFIAVGEGGENGGPRVVSITPIQETQIKPGQRVKLSVSASFPSPGEYELLLNKKPIAGVSGTKLRCIFAPRGVEGKVMDSPWVAALPAGAAEIPGFLADYSKRTGVRKFVLDETWAPRLTREVKVLTKGQRETLLKNLAEAKGTLILRLALAASARNDARDLAAMHRYVSTFVSQAKGGITALALDARALAPNAEQAARLRAYYLAVYDAAKKQNKNFLMLGASSVAATDYFLTAPTLGESLRKFVDVLAADSAAADVNSALERATGKEWKGTPVWVLPSAEQSFAPAALKALAIPVIPLAESERNVPAHLLGGSVFTERLSGPPYVSLFQGDGFAVAAIAGVGAGTLLDAEAPQGDRTGAHFNLTHITDPAGKAFVPYLEVADDTNSLRAVDAKGNPLDCRVGDILRVPLTDSLNYLLAGGAADDLGGLLKTATPYGLPPCVVVPAKAVGGRDKTPGSITVTFTNISASDLVLDAALQDAMTGAVFSEKKLPPLGPQKSTELTFSFPADTGFEHLALRVAPKSAKAVFVYALDLPNR